MTWTFHWTKINWMHHKVLTFLLQWCEDDKNPCINDWEITRRRGPLFEFSSVIFAASNIHGSMNKDENCKSFLSTSETCFTVFSTTLLRMVHEMPSHFQENWIVHVPVSNGHTKWQLSDKSESLWTVNSEVKLFNILTLLDSFQDYKCLHGWIKSLSVRTTHNVDYAFWSVFFVHETKVMFNSVMSFLWQICWEWISTGNSSTPALQIFYLSYRWWAIQRVIKREEEFRFLLTRGKVHWKTHLW